jgi:hypothetical protein
MEYWARVLSLVLPVAAIALGACLCRWGADRRGPKVGVGGGPGLLGIALGVLVLAVSIWKGVEVEQPRPGIRRAGMTAISRTAEPVAHDAAVEAGSISPQP